MRVIVSDGAELRYRVLFDGFEIVAPSRFGIVADGVNLGAGVRLGKAAPRQIDETYPLLGGHARATNHCVELTIPVACGSGEPYELDVRAYDDGAALRSRLPVRTDRRIEREVSEWHLPGDAMLWHQDNLKDYEGLFGSVRVRDLAAGQTMGLPITVALADGRYAMITEANVVDYGDAAIAVGDARALQIRLHADTEGWMTSEAVIQPWRVVLLAHDLGELVNSDLVRNLCPAPKPSLAGAKWIKPGRAAWNWWSTPTLIYEEQRDWVKWAKKLGCEYYLIDAGWEKWRTPDKNAWECLQAVCDNAKDRGVGIWIWLHSREVSDPAIRRTYFQRAKQAGVVGLKIDFIPGNSRQWMNWYEGTLRDAAELELMIDFHGACKPTGRERTWPNELTREAIRGHEWHILRYKRTMPPDYDTIAPFTRLVQGNGDYTPTVFDPAELRGFTRTRELAQAVIMTSALLCLADHPRNYLGNELTNCLRSIPATWDETVVLPGSEIGRCVAFARRSGKKWFVGVINGAGRRELDLPLTFLGPGTWNLLTWSDQPDSDTAVLRTRSKTDATKHLEFTVRAGGGFVARLEPR